MAKNPRKPKQDPDEPAGYVHADHQDEQPVQSRRARIIMAECRDLIDRNAKKVEALYGKAEASPEGAAGSLEEIAALLMNAGAYFGSRAVVLRHGVGKVNPMLAAAGRSVRDNLITAASQLDGEQHTAHSWKAAENRVSEAKKVISHVLGFLECDGVSLVVREDEPLVDAAGEPLVP